MVGFLKCWQYIFAPNSRQRAGIALKTSPIESYQFSASKLCPDFFFNSEEKYIFFGVKNIFQKKIGQKYFSVKIQNFTRKKSKFSKFCQNLGIFENFDNFKLRERQAPGLSENVSTGFGQLQGSLKTSQSHFYDFRFYFFSRA